MLSFKRSRLAKTYFVVTLSLAAALSVLTALADIAFLLDEGEQSLAVTHERLLLSYQEPLSHALWVLDDRQLSAQLRGILALPDVSYVALTETELAQSVGERVSGDSTISSTPIEFEFQGETIRLAALHIHSPLSAVYQRTLVIAARRIGFNLLQAIPLVLLSFYFFNLLINQRLGQVHRHIQQEGGFLSASPKALVLDSKALMTDQRDEINDIALALNQLSAEAASLGATLDSMSDWVMTLNMQGEVVHLNRAATLELCGQDKRLLGKNLDSCFLEQGWRVDANESSWSLLSRIKTIAKQPLPTQFECRNPQGDPHFFLISCTSVITPEHQHSGWVLVMRDITQEVVLKKRLTKNENLLTLGQLAGGVAHDFNNALSSIVSSVELLQTIPSAQRDNRQKRLLRIIEQSADGAVSLVAKLLDFARTSPASRQPLSVSQLVCDVADILESTLSKGVVIEVNDHSSRSTISGDRAALQNALMNLCINANKAMPLGGTITLGLENMAPCELSVSQRLILDAQDDSVLRLTVQDTGCGIAPEHLQKIFEPFFSTRLGQGGTGLGLSMVYRTLAEHRGCIEVNSELGQGTCFEILLPVNQSSSSAQRGHNTDSHLTHYGHVLLVERDPLVQKSSASQLVHLGFVVTAVSEPNEAWQQMQTRSAQFDLLLANLDFPNPEAEDLLKQMMQASEAPCILYGDAFPASLLARLEMPGLCAHLTKPLKLAELSQCVDHCLPRRTSRADLENKVTG